MYSSDLSYSDKSNGFTHVLQYLFCYYTNIVITDMIKKNYAYKFFQSLMLSSSRLHELCLSVRCDLSSVGEMWVSWHWHHTSG